MRCPSPHSWRQAEGAQLPAFGSVGNGVGYEIPGMAGAEADRCCQGWGRGSFWGEESALELERRRLHDPVNALHATNCATDNGCDPVVFELHFTELFKTKENTALVFLSPLGKRLSDSQLCCPSTGGPPLLSWVGMTAGEILRCPPCLAGGSPLPGSLPG